MTGKEFIQLLKEHEDDEIVIYMSKQNHPHVDFNHIANDPHNDGYALCAPRIREGYKGCMFIEPGTVVGG